MSCLQNDRPIATDQALRLGSCGGQQGLLLDQLKDALTTVSGRAVVSVCEGVPLAEIQDLQQFIQASKLPYAAAYLGQPDHVSTISSQVCHPLGQPMTNECTCVFGQ